MKLLEIQKIFSDELILRFVGKGLTVVRKPFMIITILLAASILNSCNINMVKSDQAHRALRVFFMYLANSDYIMATAFLAGNYEALAVLNPDLDPADHAALWKRGCQNNGLKCLAIRTASFIRNGEFRVLDLPVYVP